MTSDERTALALERIAAALEGLLESTNPLNPLEQWYDTPDKQRVFYTDEEKEIIRLKLAEMGKEYKERV